MKKKKKKKKKNDGRASLAYVLVEQCLTECLVVDDANLGEILLTDDVANGLQHDARRRQHIDGRVVLKTSRCLLYNIR